ncbi:MAG: hypothetical protein PHO72_11725 [Sphaerochaeta sp.]|nr:hypothetical protein [Sphaerochaeta sp.]
MKKLDKSILLILACAAVLALAGCSSVFNAGLSGTLTDKDTGNGIPGVLVYAYTDEDLRDADYARGATTGSDGMTLTFSPTTGGNYIPTTSTNDNGYFTISKLIWENAHPEFGKTADYFDVYLLYFKSDYGLVKEDSKVTIVSDSNNSSRVNTTLTSRLGTKTITLNVKDIADDEAAAVAFDLKIKAFITGNTEPYLDAVQAVTGTGTVSVSYLKSDPAQTTVKVTVSPAEDSTWKFINSNPDAGEYYKAASGYAVEHAFASGEDDSITMTAYVKNYKFDYPMLSGVVDTETDYTDSNSKKETQPDNESINLWLGTLSNGDLTVIDDTKANIKTSHTGDGANSSLVTYGTFSNFGDGLEWVPSELITDASATHYGDYQAKIATCDVYLVIDNLDAGTVGKADPSDYFLKVSFKSSDQSDQALGTLNTKRNSIHIASYYSITSVVNPEP